MDNIRVLIVDDLLHVRQGLLTVLNLVSRNIGVRIEVVGEAENGRKAIEQAYSLHPDVILMDLEMPVLDGYEATLFIKQTALSVWIIALTIHGDPISRQKALQAGADAFIEKGTPLDDLIHAILKSRRSL